MSFHPSNPDKQRTSPPPISFLFKHPAHLIACGFGSGLSPFAPGTAGTLFAWLTFPLLQQSLPNELHLLVFLLAAFVIGVVACDRTGRALGVIDHGSIVWDEIVPFWMVLLFCPAGLLWQAAAFFLFRFFDVFKPAPASYFDRHVKNGFGVMCDDAVAAGYSVLVLALARFALDTL